MGAKTRTLDLFIAAATAAAATALVVTGIDIPILRAGLAAAIVFILPGYALTRALFVHATFGVAGQVAGSIGASVGVAIVLGQVLNVTPWGLRPASWTIGLCSVTLAAAAVAAWRGRGAIEKAPPVATRRHLRTVAAGWVPFIPTGLIAGAAFWIATTGAAQGPTHGFTQLWIVPVAATAAEPRVDVGVVSMEVQTVRYLLQLKIGSRVIQEWPTVVLQPHQQWDRTVTVPTTGLGRSKKVPIVALLYRQDTPRSVYRRVVQWQDLSTPPTAARRASRAS